MDSIKEPAPLQLLPTCSEEDNKRAPKNTVSSEWPHKAVSVLLDIYVQKFFAGRGCLRSKDWEEVMNKVNTECEGLKTLRNAKQCRDKVDSLKRRYKAEKRKAVNGEEVTWPFFDKLDDMMGSALRQTRGFKPMDRLQKASLFIGHEMKDFCDDDHEKQGFSGSPEGCEGRRNQLPFYMGLPENGKAKADDKYPSSEEGSDIDPFQRPSKFHKPTAAHHSPDISSGHGKRPQPPWPGASSKNRARPREIESDSSVQALADAITGFSEVYARVELAKLEIMTTMKLEFAKLARRRRRRHRRESSSRSSSTNHT
ncbi:hypothetical protein KP509_02G072600 [Ceratopteris richardii]|uniref:Myb/SANT-like DNA-binding domain-containing protein n=1 Tax=Ceratopteris richardii TaxID=49495 RepID=A0A8T2VB35_CERRI|nr:hypothetical protein KP509_02G072600 [Ceratopteris richardii]